MSDPDAINRYVQTLKPILVCPECGSRNVSEPDDEGLIDCENCGIWFNPKHPNNRAAHQFVSEDADDTLDPALYLTRLYPYFGDQLEARGFTRCLNSHWHRELPPGWKFEVYYEAPTVNQLVYSNDPQGLWRWFLRITWLPTHTLVLYDAYNTIPALMADVDRHVAAWQGKRYLGTKEDRIIVEVAASVPLALGLLEADDDQRVFPNMGMGYEQERLPFNPPLEQSFPPPPPTWRPPRKPPQDPDDFDPMDYIEQVQMSGERRIAISYSETWFPEGQEDYEEEHGWENEEGVDLSVDEFDDEGTTPVDKAVKWLKDNGAWDTGNDDCYSSEPEQNYHNGHSRERNFHLQGYTDEELAEIYERVVPNRPHRRNPVGEALDPDDPQAFLNQFAEHAPHSGTRWIDADWHNAGPVIVYTDLRTGWRRVSIVVDGGVGPSGDASTEEVTAALASVVRQIRARGYKDYVFSVQMGARDADAIAALENAGIIRIRSRSGHAIYAEAGDQSGWLNRVAEAQDPDDPASFIQNHYTQPPPKILTTSAYWNSISPAVKQYWRNVASNFNEYGIVVCTGRPNSRTYQGTTSVRRASTGGKWAKSSDTVKLNVNNLLAHGFVWSTDLDRRIIEAQDPDDPAAFMQQHYANPPIKNITVFGQRWFQRGPGNTYFTAQIIVNNKLVHTLPMQYGYGNHYLDVAFDWLENKGYVNRESEHEPPWQTAKRMGFDLRYEATDVPRKRDLNM